MCFACALILVQHEVFQVQNAELLQSFFMLSGVVAFRARGLCLFKYPLEICSYDQARAFLVNLRNTCAERRGGKSADASFLTHCREGLYLLQPGTRGEKIVRDPDIEPFIFLLI